ncbi:hypothetical protein SAMN04487995_3569 [Dyadobacter koreensis]|uniref:Uncharacterized protein n=1 Tax=Dyadobacter koreensis TaxID=408657 RepID=A0A1H6WQV9_9BACT|nr:hypothetical protein [Dyadobacter koreensis]SEJ16607.1 hypothetical protein SAMN04487995_3569 [Dyadobacter koreensis]
MRFISEDDADVRPLWMSPQEISDPSEFIRQFCRMHSIADCRFFLWQMLSNSVSANNTDADASAGEQLYFFENLMPFIEAVFLLQYTDAEKVVDVSSENNAYHENIESSVSDKNSVMGASDYFPLTDQIEKSKLKKKLKKLKYHSVWYRERINDPCQVIQSFFDYSSLMSFKTNLYEILKVTSEDYFYQKGSPNSVSHHLERLESIINVAYLMNGENLGHIDIKSKLEDPQLPPVTQEMSHSLLTKEEILNPEKVLTSFFDYKSLKEWKKALIEINDFALSKHPAHEWGVWIDALPVFVHSVKLAEALCLIGCSEEQHIEQR